MKQSASSDLSRYSVSVNGQADNVDGTQSTYIGDSTRSHKDTNVVLCEILADLIERGNGEP